MKAHISTSAFVIVQYPGEKNVRKYKLNNVLEGTADAKFASLINVFLPFISQDSEITSIVVQQNHEHFV